MPSTIELGVLAFQEGRFEEATALFEAVMQVQPDHLKIVFLLGRCYLAQERFSEARKVFTQLVASEDAPLREKGRAGLAELGDRGLAEGTPASDLRPCPRCGQGLSPEQTSACVCGWGRRLPGNRLYLDHVMELAGRSRLTVELKLMGDLYAIDQEVRLKHMSDHASLLDPREVFRVDRGVPYLLAEDLAPVMPKVDDRASFRLRRGQELGAGKLIGWAELFDRMRQQQIDPAVLPDGSLGSLLTRYGQIPADAIRQADAARGAATLGTALLHQQTCTLQALLAGALGATRVFAPRHHQANHVGHLLLEAGALEADQLKRAISTQVKRLRPLDEILKPKVEREALRSARAQVAMLPPQAPEHDRLGELLIAMGVLSRTDLASALQERRKLKKLIGQILKERGMISEEALKEALSRQQLKRELRMAGTIRLGEVLIEQGAISRRELAMALFQQIGDSRPLGELLVQAGACTPERLITAMAEQESRIEARVGELWQEELARQEAGAPEEEAAPRRGRKRAAAPSEEEESERSPGFPWRWALGLGGGILAIACVASLVPRLLTPAEPAAAPPMLQAAAAPQGLPAAFAGLQTQRRVEVNVDEVMANIEQGKEDPVGAAMHAAYRQPIPPAVARMAEQAVNAQEAAHPALPSRVAALEDPVAADDPTEEVREQSVKQVMSTSPAALEGDRLLATGQHQAALRAFQAAARETPGDPTTLGKLAAAQLRNGQAPQAEATLQRAASLAPREATIYGQLGEARLAQGNVTGAIAAYHEAAARDPHNAEYPNQLGLVLKGQGRNDEAAAAFAAAARVDASNPNGPYNLALIEAADRPKLAREHLAQAQQGFADQVATRMALGEALKAQGDAAGALRSFDGALRANTLLAESHLILGKLEAHEHRLPEAKRCFETAELTFQTNALAHTLRGDALQGLGQRRDAIAEYVVATRIAPDFAAPYLELGRIARSRGHRVQARHYLQMASAADPRGAEGRRARQDLATLGP